MSFNHLEITKNYHNEAKDTPLYMVYMYTLMNIFRF